MNEPASAALREARAEDCDTLVEMMAAFYAESSYPLNRRRARGAFRQLLQHPALGRVWILEESGAEAGYVVLVIVYSMEYGGLSAVIDDFYIRPAYRGRGAGSRALESVKLMAAGLGVRAIRLEVGRDNTPALAVYRKAGFVDTDRRLLTLHMSDPTHVE